MVSSGSFTAVKSTVVSLEIMSAGPLPLTEIDQSAFNSTARICAVSTPPNLADSPAIKVQFNVVDSDAENQAQLLSDYTLDGYNPSVGAYEVTIQPGQGNACVDLAVVDDRRRENLETFELRIDAVSFASASVVPLDRNADPLEISITDEDKVHVRVEFGSTEAVAEQQPLAGGDVEASGHIRVSLWDTSNTAAFSDDLGGMQRIEVSFDTGTVPSLKLCSDLTTPLEEGIAEDFCLRKPIRSTGNTSYILGINTTANAVQIDYERMGQREFRIDIVAPVDHVAEGTETFDLNPGDSDVYPELAGSSGTFDTTADAGYILASVASGFSLEDGEDVALAYRQNGERVNSVSSIGSVDVGEGTTAILTVGFYNERTGEPVTLDQDIQLDLTLSGMGVSDDTMIRFVEDAANAGVSLSSSAAPSSNQYNVATFSFTAANSMRSVVLGVEHDDDSISETAMLVATAMDPPSGGEVPNILNRRVTVVSVDDDDGVSPSACAAGDRGIGASVTTATAIDERAGGQAGCVRVVGEPGAYGFELEWDAALDRQEVEADHLTQLTYAAPYRVYFGLKGAGACSMPARAPIEQTANGEAGGAVPALAANARPTGYPYALSAIAALETAIYEGESVSSGTRALQADTDYCVLLGVSDGAWMDWAPAIEVRTAAYSPQDDDMNEVPDHLQLGELYGSLSEYLNAQCGQIAEDDIANADCDGDSVPDAVELHFGRASDVALGFETLNCRANGLRTPLATALSELICSGATDAIAGLSAESLVHAADNGSVPNSAAAPDALGDGGRFSGRYWLSNGTADSLVQLNLEPALAFSAPELVSSDGSMSTLKMSVRMYGQRPRMVDTATTASLASQELTVSLVESGGASASSTPTAQVAVSIAVTPSPAAVDSPTEAGALGSALLEGSFASTGGERLMLTLEWNDAVGGTSMTQTIETTTTAAAHMELTLAPPTVTGGVIDDRVVTLAEAGTGALTFTRPSGATASGDYWAVNVAGASFANLPAFYGGSTDALSVGSALPGVSLREDVLTLSIEALLSESGAELPARLVVSWSSADMSEGAHIAILVYAAASTPSGPSAETKKALLDGYEVGHYRDSEEDEARDVPTEPGARVRLGDYAAQQCLANPDRCAGRDEMPDAGLRLLENLPDGTRHPACQTLGGEALACVDFQLLCEAGEENCMANNAIDVVFPLSGELRASHWLYYSLRVVNVNTNLSERIACPFVQNDMPAHVRVRAGCPGVDETAVPPAFVAGHPDRLYVARKSAAACPPASDPSWEPLAELQSRTPAADLSDAGCLRASYSDGGPNDASRYAVGLISDPMVVGTAGGGGGVDPLAGNFGSDGGGGSAGAWALLGLALLTLLGLAGARRRRLLGAGALALALSMGWAADARALEWPSWLSLPTSWSEFDLGEGEWAVGLDAVFSGYDRGNGAQEDADDDDYGWRARADWDFDGRWGEGLGAEVWWADLGSAALRASGGGEALDFDYEAYGVGLNWSVPLNVHEDYKLHAYLSAGWRDIEVGEPSGFGDWNEETDGAYFGAGVGWDVSDWFDAPAGVWSLRVSYDVFDSEGVDYFGIGLSRRMGGVAGGRSPKAKAKPAKARAQAKPKARRMAERRRAIRASCGEWDSCACQKLVNPNARGWYVQVATYGDAALARKRAGELREAGYSGVGVRSDRRRDLHALRVSTTGSCRQAETMKRRLDALMDVDSMLRGWRTNPY